MGKFGVDANDCIVFFDDGMQFGSGRIAPFGIKEGFGEALRDVVSDGTVTFMNGTVCIRRGMVIWRRRIGWVENKVSILFERIVVYLHLIVGIGSVNKICPVDIV